MSPDAGPGSARGRLVRDRLRRVVLGVVLGVVASGALALATVARRLHQQAAPPPTLGRLPDFALTDQAGRPFTASSLEGRRWVVDFIFTRCTSICPRLTDRLKEVDRWAARRPAVAGPDGSGLGLLSISVDPEHDTPPVLRAYAKDHGLATGAEGGRWHLVTGAAEPVLEVVTRGFKIAVGDARTDEQGRLDILHGGHLALLDDQRRIRGYFEADDEGLRALEATLLRLSASEPPRAP